MRGKILASLHPKRGLRIKSTFGYENTLSGFCFGISILAVMGAGLCLMCTSLTPLEQVLVPQILFLGLFIRIDQMPVWLSWAQYLCSAKYGLNLAMLIEFEPSLAINAQIAADWANLLEYNAVYYSEVWLYCVVLFAIFAVFRFLALISLNYKAKQLG
jgi:hypothetical protein